MGLNATNLFIQASPLPATFKGTPNDMFVEMIKRMRILSPSGTNFIFIGDTAPTSNVGPWLKNGTQWYVWDPATKQYAPQDISASFTPAFSIGNSKPVATDPPVWLQTTLDPISTNPNFFGQMIRWYVYDGVNWLSPHPTPPNSGECRIWTRSESELWGYDGGDGTNPSSNPPTDTTGAMWIVETAFQFKFPLGAGQNSQAFDGGIASTVGPGEVGGDERVTLTNDDLPAHKHFTVNADGATIANPLTGANFVTVKTNYGGSTDEYQLAGTSTPPSLGITDTVGGNPEVSHQNMPPFLGVYFIKRSVRRYYTA